MTSVPHQTQETREDMSPEQVVRAVCKITKYRLLMRDDPTFGNKFVFPIRLERKVNILTIIQITVCNLSQL